MKKTNFLYASLMMAACTFGVQSCTVDDNPAPDPTILTEVLTYDFEAAASSQDVYNKLNGNQSNGQAFPWWKDESNSDRDRNEWKGYAYDKAVDNILPEECHIWSNHNPIIGTIIKDGGITLTQNCGFVVDGLKDGSIVQIFYTASKEVEVDDTTSLKDVKFYGVNKDTDGDAAFGKDAKTTGDISPIWVVGQSTGQPYGDGSVNAFADLSAYEKLIVVATEGTPRIMLNRSKVEGQYNGEDETASALIEYPKCESSWAGKYFSVKDVDGGKEYTVDLAQIYKDFGYVHLHAIKGANWANCTVTSMSVVGKKKVTVPTDDKLIWAVGDGSSNNNGTPLITASVDGVDAVSGQTEIPSGAIIKVLNTALYKNNTTGHIVVNAMKGMTIKKVVITNFTEQMPY